MQTPKITFPHTPWAVEEKPVAGYFHVENSKGAILARVPDYNKAVLMASSHDLLDNLKNLCNVFGFGLDPVKNECAYRAIANARAAIAKAEGGAA